MEGTVVVRESPKLASCESEEEFGQLQHYGDNNFKYTQVMRKIYFRGKPVGYVSTNSNHSLG